MKDRQTSQRTPGAVIYTRVSTGEQAKEGTSLDSQRDACHAKALALGLPIVAEYEDAGISGGFLLTRPGMQAALADISMGRADTLICANISRYSRDTEHQQAIKKAVRAAGGRLVFCDMDFDDTPEGDLAFGVLGTFAEYERRVIRARTMRGKRKRAEEGQQPQRSRSAYGYHIVTNAEVAAGLHPSELRGRYLIQEATAAVVRRLFADYNTGGYGSSRLCLALNQEGVPTPGGGRAWREATLRVILMNPAYKGEPVSGRQKCSTDESRLGQRHKLTGRLITTPDVRSLVPEEMRLTLSSPPLVTEAVWDAVQERLARGRAQNSGNPRQVRMLSGQTFCPFCGSKTGFKLQQANGKRYHYLICNAHKDARYQFGGSPCRGDLYPMATVEEAVLQAMRDAWQKPSALAAAQKAYEHSAPVSAPQDTPAAQAVMAALEELKAEETATARAQIAGIRAGAAPDVYAAMFADIAARRKALQQELQASPAPPAPRSRKKVSSEAAKREVALLALEQAWRVLNSPDVEGHVKRDLLLTVIDKVICQKDGAEVVFRPGVFGENAETETDKEAGVPTLYTTCMGINTQR
jgi:site-specific DNA recombinase